MNADVEYVKQAKVIEIIKAEIMAKMENFHN